MTFFKNLSFVWKFPTPYVTLPLSSSTEKWIPNKVMETITRPNHAASGDASEDSNPKHKSSEYTDLLLFLCLTCQTTPYNLGESLIAP